MKRCETCGGPFGLIRHYHYAHQFCSRRCKNRYLQRLAEAVARRRSALARLTGLAGRLRAQHQS
ncbi:MAG: hypothetical protein M5U07_16165 [Xanthobacteraceae bacterium]|nr:hypothetical protein [Xanthobacteraceae bacterium]PWB59825.1 MAG: hypothetical protein C3F17_15910 [Bradyrhizobiaceae bacterium]